MPKPIHIKKPALLLAHLFESWPEVAKTQVRKWLKSKSIVVNGLPITRFDHALKPGDVVRMRTDHFAVPETKLPGGIKIRHEDAEIMVIEKPAGLLSIASEGESHRTAYYQLTAYLREGRPKARERVWIVHRLDRETSGLMVFAKTPFAKDALQAAWEATEKRYLAVVEGVPSKDAGTFESHLNETNPFRVHSAPRSENTRHAVTHYRVLRSGRERALVELTLVTGRRHQIRVHLADAGHPIVGDEKYNAATNPAGRLGLHSSFLKLLHPSTRNPLQFESRLPRALAGLV